MKGVGTLPEFWHGEEAVTTERSFKQTVPGPGYPGAVTWESVGNTAIIKSSGRVINNIRRFKTAQHQPGKRPVTRERASGNLKLIVKHGRESTRYKFS